MSVRGGACKACRARKLQSSAAAHNRDNPSSGNNSGTISQLTNADFIKWNPALWPA